MPNSYLQKNAEIPSHLAILAFLDGRREEDKNNAIVGQERRRLKAAVIPHLTPQQYDYFSKFPKHFDDWLSHALFELVGYESGSVTNGTVNNQGAPSSTPHVVVRIHARSLQILQNYLENRPKELEGKPIHGQERRRLKALLIPSLTPKQRQLYSESPACFDKYLTNSILQRRKYTSIIEKRQAELEEELANHDGAYARTPAEIHELVQSKFDQVGLLPEYPDKTMRELVEEGTIVPYYGIATCCDRFYGPEPLRFLCDKQEKNRAVWMWHGFPFEEPRKITDDEALDILKAKTVLLDRKACLCGFEMYMLERAFQAVVGDKVLGVQKLNRVVGAGQPYRRQPGVYYVFVTYFETAVIEELPIMINI